jgi:hypothetical protein
VSFFCSEDRKAPAPRRQTRGSRHHLEAARRPAPPGDLAAPEVQEILRTPYTADRLMRENCEKLFTAHLRLPKLAASDIRDLTETFSGRRADDAVALDELRKQKAVLVSESRPPETIAVRDFEMIEARRS